ncbi:hypothetical protein P3T35_000511 [Kitasatospora sp. GP30]|uniref:hypothetical protein n=1 Tax=Kitasatospora sp. GP30 TaxID=3035084 RepID=UPI000C70FE9C|nr:hypothetical protein [Kitasatospora sp. GP30]MDH6138534.1 hypothetical protein [Kitasatospora sp. GP30]
MGTDPLDRMVRRLNLTDALQAHFGPCREWPIQIKAAYAQLDQLRNLIGDERYAELINCAEEGIEKWARFNRREVQIQYIGLALFKQHEDESPELKVAWAILYGLHVLLDRPEFERLVAAASAALAADADDRRDAENDLTLAG